LRRLQSPPLRAEVYFSRTFSTVAHFLLNFAADLLGLSLNFQVRIVGSVSQRFFHGAFESVWSAFDLLQT
jgi:hypothetical protein